MDRIRNLIEGLTLIQLSYAVYGVLILFLIYLIFALCAYVPLLRKVINYHMDEKMGLEFSFGWSGVRVKSILPATPEKTGTGKGERDKQAGS